MEYYCSISNYPLKIILIVPRRYVCFYYRLNGWIYIIYPTPTAGIATKRSVVWAPIHLVHLSNLYKVAHITINKSCLISHISPTFGSIKEGPTYTGPCGFGVWVVQKHVKGQKTQETTRSCLYKVAHITINKSFLISHISPTFGSIKEGITCTGPCGFGVWVVQKHVKGQKTQETTRITK